MSLLRRRWPWTLVALLYAGFLVWHQPWLVPRLSAAEVEAAFEGRLGSAKIHGDDKARLKAFFASDDGQSFYNLNLMRFSERAIYLDGKPRPGISSGSDANDAYSRVVIPLLLQRGSYPVLATSKISNLLLEAAPGADFFQEVAIVRYRSRRDMLDMILDPDYIAGAPHKFASLAQNVAVPTRSVLVADLSLFVPLFLVALALLLSGLQKRDAMGAN